MFVDLWNSVRGRHGPVPRPVALSIELPEEDEPESLVVIGEGVPAGPLDAVSGFSCVIAYRDGRGRPSQRRITCIRLERAGDLTYVRAYCHERQMQRQFRTDRIEAVCDLHTAEMVADDGANFFSRFQVDHEQETSLSWGLSVQQKQDLVAGLNALVFMARCDSEWHEAEQEAIERFVTSYWIRNELSGEPPIEVIMAHASRIAPDPEVFYMSLSRCSERPALALVIRRAIQMVIEADERIHEREFYWGSAVDDYFRQLAQE